MLHLFPPSKTLESLNAQKKKGKKHHYFFQKSISLWLQVNVIISVIKDTKRYAVISKITHFRLSQSTFSLTQAKH